VRLFTEIIYIDSFRFLRLLFSLNRIILINNNSRILTIYSLL